MLAGNPPFVGGVLRVRTRLGPIGVEQAATQEADVPVIPSSDPAALSHRHNDLDSAVRLRLAGADDAAPIALLHADSWRRHYRGAYADSFLDGDIVADRRSVWSARLDATAHTRTFVADAAGRVVGFIHVVFDHDPQWGSLVDNLHVTHDQHRTGIGTDLLSCAARAAAERARTNRMHLWVLEQNTAAQHFYRARGASPVETAIVSPPGGDPSRLHGTPRKLRMAWSDAGLHIA